MTRQQRDAAQAWIRHFASTRAVVKPESKPSPSPMSAFLLRCYEDGAFPWKSTVWTDAMTRPPIDHSGADPTSAVLVQCVLSDDALRLQQELEKSPPSRSDLDSLFSIASERRFPPVLLVLIQHGANVEGGVPKSSNTFLHAAAWKGDEVILRLLHRFSKAPPGADARGRTPLHLACQPDIPGSRRLRIVEFLLDHAPSIEINACDGLGRTSLFYAVRTGCRELLSLLLQRGASPVIQDARGSSPVEQGRNDAARRLFVELVEKYATRDDVVGVHARLVTLEWFRNMLKRLPAHRCSVCRRPRTRCDLLRKSQHRLWLYVHSRAPSTAFAIPSDLKVT